MIQQWQNQLELIKHLHSLLCLPVCQLDQLDRQCLEHPGHQVDQQDQCYHAHPVRDTFLSNLNELGVNNYQSNCHNIMKYLYVWTGSSPSHQQHHLYQEDHQIQDYPKTTEVKTGCQKCNMLYRLLYIKWTPSVDP